MVATTVIAWGLLFMIPSFVLILVGKYMVSLTDWMWTVLGWTMLISSLVVSVGCGMMAFTVLT